jgi:two-component system, chemotaxis family, sensor kinase CheA
MSVSFSSQARRGVARVLLADAGLASRLVVKSILSAAGYCVSGAASGAEAIGKLDEDEYQLVLADLRSESDDAGPRLLAYARQKEFRPATALLSSDLHETSPSSGFSGGSDHRAVHISYEDVSYLIGNVADLISRRANRRIRQSLLKAV